MRAVLIALGNTLRRDDGVAHRAIELLGPVRGATVIDRIQLSPEIAEDIAEAGTVVFIDADLEAGETRIEPVAGPVARSSPLAHSVSPEEVLELSRRLFGFTGQAWLCRIPAQDFSAGEGLSELAERNAQVAAQLLRGVLDQ